MAFCEAVSVRGGGHGWEHPGDRVAQPYPSIWATTEMVDLESRTKASRATHHQCDFGAPFPKLTTISGTLDCLDSLNDLWCPGTSASHKHGLSKGIDKQGRFRTKRLQAYTCQYSRAIANCIFATAKRLSDTGQGPTGYMRTHCHIQRSTDYGFRHLGSEVPSISLLNEDVTFHRQVMLDQFQSAMYLHVDDLLCLSISSSLSVHADVILDSMTEALEGAGFTIPTDSQQRDDILEKIIGYTIWRDRGRFTVAINKWVLLRDSLLEIAQGSLLDAEVARSVVGVWLFAALLRRDALCIPYAIFHFMERYEGRKVPPSARVRKELLAMAASVPLLFYSFTDPIAKVALASDAMGSNEQDLGGYGVMARCLSDEQVRNALEVGGAPAKSIARLNGELSGP